MKKIYIGILALGIFSSLNCYGKTVNYYQHEKDYLEDSDEFQAIENYSFKTIIGREAGTVNEVEENIFDSAHVLLSGSDDITTDYGLMNKLNYDSKLLYPKEEREDPITADDIIKVNREYDRLNKNSKSPLKSFSDVFSSNRSYDKATVNKSPIKKAAPLTDSYVDITNENKTQKGFVFQDTAKANNDVEIESYGLDSNIISYVGKYEQKEMLKELTKKDLFSRNV